MAHVIRPFSTHRATAIVAAPKVYGFDTGFVSYYRGWQELRQEDMGVRWEHFVLNEIMGHQQTREISYWRDKAGHEVDFVLAGRRNKPLAVECKWSASDFDASNLKVSVNTIRMARTWWWLRMWTELSTGSLERLR